NAARIGEIGEPWGIPFSTCLMSPRIPSMQTAASRLLRNEATHLTYWIGMCLFRSSQSSRSWLTKSK
ncbi:hypothetical protein BDN72DRAFT_775437, partial [Pluteus cervinus]